MVWSVILGLLTIAAIVAMLFGASPFLILIPYCIYCGWSKMMPSSNYIGNCIELPQVFTDADRTIANKPEVKFEIECYHYDHSKKDDEKKSCNSPCNKGLYFYTMV